MGSQHIKDDTPVSVNFSIVVKLRTNTELKIKFRHDNPYGTMAGVSYIHIEEI